MLFLSRVCCSWRIVFHDISQPWSGVWWSSGDPVLLGKHIRDVTVHPGSHRDTFGEKEASYPRVEWTFDALVLISQTYIAPQASLFGTISGNPSVLYNNMRVYGTILLLLMSIIVFVGVKLVSLASPAFQHLCSFHPCLLSPLSFFFKTISFYSFLRSFVR